LTIGSQRVTLLEQFINNQNDTLKQPGFTGLPNMAVEVIGKTDIDIRRDLFSNIILTGGNSCYRGFPERLQRQIPEIAPPN
jgi:actin-related protein